MIRPSGLNSMPCGSSCDPFAGIDRRHSRNLDNFQNPIVEPPKLAGRRSPNEVADRSSGATSVECISSFPVAASQKRVTSSQDVDIRKSPERWKQAETPPFE